MKIDFSLSIGSVALQAGGGVYGNIILPMTNRGTNRYATQTSDVTEPARLDGCIRHEICADGIVGPLIYCGHSFQAGTLGDIFGTVTRTMDEVYLEYDGAMHQVTFNGGNPGFSIYADEEAISDYPILDSRTGRPLIGVKGTYLWEKNSHRQDSTTWVAALVPKTALGEYAIYRSAASDPAASHLIGSPGALTPTATRNAWGAASINGRHKSPAIWIIGNSIADGSGGDTTIAVTDNPGYLARSVDGEYPILRMTCPSASLPSVQHALRNLRLTRGHVKYAWGEMGINNVLGNDTLTLIQARYRAVWQQLRESGVKYIIWNTLLPAVTSTDGCTTEANQTPITQEAVRVSVNQWLLTIPEEIDAVIDVTLGIEVGRTVSADAFSGKMTVLGGVNPYGDTSGTFIHPTPARNELIASIVKPTLMAVIDGFETVDASNDGTGDYLPAPEVAPPITVKTAQVDLTADAAALADWDRWNANTTSSKALLDQLSDTSSGWTITRSAAPTISSTFGAWTGGNFGAFIDAAIYGGARGSATITYPLSGLDTGKTYNLKMMGSRDDPISGAGLYTTAYSVAGATSSAVQNVDCLVNSDRFAEFLNIAPDGSGNIVITVARAAGASFSMFNALRIEEN